VSRPGLDSDRSQVGDVSCAEDGQLVAILLPVLHAVLVPANLPELVELPDHRQRWYARRDSLGAVVIYVAGIGAAILHQAEAARRKLSGTPTCLRPARGVPDEHQWCGGELAIAGCFAQFVEHFLDVDPAESAFEKHDRQLLLRARLANAFVLSHFALHQRHAPHHHSAHLERVRWNPQIRRRFLSGGRNRHGVLENGCRRFAGAQQQHGQSEKRSSHKSTPDQTLRSQFPSGLLQQAGWHR
jgi:hypothetical protein